MYLLNNLNFIIIIFLLGSFYSVQSYPSGLINKKIICKDSVLGQATETQLFEKYKLCVKLFIESELPAKDKKTESFISDIIANINLNKSEYINRFKFYQIKTLLSRDHFVAEEAIISLVSDYKTNKIFSTNVQQRHYELLAHVIENEIKRINDKITSEKIKGKNVSDLENIFFAEVDKKILELKTTYKFSEIDIFLQNTLDSLSKSDLLAFLRRDFMYTAQSFYFTSYSFEKALKYTDTILELETQQPNSFFLDKIKLLFWKGDYKSCSNFQFPPRLNVEAKTIAIKIIKYKMFCEFESGTITAKDMLVKIESAEELKKSVSDYVHLKSELLIADEQVDAALSLLEKTDDAYDTWRAADLLLYKKNKEKALRFAYKTISEDKDKAFIWQLEKNMKLSLLYFLNKPNLKDFAKNFTYILPICENLIRVVSPKAKGFLLYCSTIKTILTSDSAKNIKFLLLQNKKTNNEKLSKFKTVDIFEQYL